MIRSYYSSMMKLRKIESCWCGIFNSTWKKKDFSISVSEISENIYKYLLELIKTNSKVQEKNMSCERALNFDQWKTFSEKYKPIRVWLRLFYQFTENIVGFLQANSNLKELSYLPWQNKYPNLKTTSHIKPKFF